jgi:Transposase DDE domain
MTHPTVSSLPPFSQEENRSHLERMLLDIAAQEPASVIGKRKPGRPRVLSGWHLCLGLLVCLMRGWHAQRDLWRLISFEGFGHFVPLGLSDQAIYKRLEEDGTSVHQQLFAHLSQWLRQHLAPYEACHLAPKALAVVALDESVLDQVARTLSCLRPLPKGDPRLLPGRLSCLFDIRLQQWLRVDVLADATANCKRHARAMLTSLQPGTLVLFDRGYFSFPWLDELTEAGFFWISRTVGKTRYPLLHVYYQADGILDALVQVGAYRADRAAYTVRLVRFRVGSQSYSYLTNVTDPALLPLADIARLYARRWDIELAFLALKEHLGLNLLWSAKPMVIQQQIWSCLILAQLFHAFQVELAARADVEPYEVSLDLVIRLTPRLYQQGVDPMGFLLEHGRAMQVIRPSTRFASLAPDVPLWQIIYPPEEVVLVRPARSAHRKCHSRHTSHKGGN